MARRSAQSPGRLQAALSALDMLRLKVTGMSVEDIAAKAGLHRTTVWKRIQGELEAIRKERGELAQEVLEQELMRLDMMHYQLSERAGRGDPAAISVQLQVQARRAKYLGLDKQGDAPDPDATVTKVTIRREATVTTTTATPPAAPVTPHDPEAG